jgi:hypothetical protein
MKTKIHCLIFAAFVISLAISPVAQHASAQDSDKAKTAAAVELGGRKSAAG